MIGILVRKLEGKEVHPGYLLVSLLSIIFVRNFFESPASAGEVFYPISTHMEFTLWYLNAFLSVAIILYLITKTDMRRVLTVVTLGSTLILLPPAIDYTVSSLTSHSIEYVMLIIKPSAFPLYFLTLGWDYSGYGYSQILDNFCQGTDMCGITPGIRIEIALIVLLSFLYVREKTKSVKKSAGGAFLVYTAITLWGSNPTFIAPASVPESLLSVSTYLGLSGMFGSFVKIFYSVFLAFQLSLLLFLWNRKKFLAVARNLRTERMILAISVYLFGAGFASVIDPMAALACLISVFFTVMFGIMVNDLHDTEIDRVLKKPRPLVTGSLSSNEMWVLACSSLCLALLCSLVNELAFIFILASNVLFFLYSAPPFRLKTVPFSTIVTALIGVLFFGAGFYANDAVTPFQVRMGLMFLVCFTLSFNTKDLGDYEGDSKGGIKTMMTVFGPEKGKKIIAMLDLLAYALVPVILSNILLSYSLIFGLITAYVIMKRGAREREIFLTYYAFAILLAFSLLRG